LQEFPLQQLSVAAADSMEMDGHSSERDVAKLESQLPKVNAKAQAFPLQVIYRKRVVSEQDIPLARAKLPQAKEQTEAYEWMDAHGKSNACCGIKRNRVLSNDAIAADVAESIRHFNYNDQSEFSNLVFTSLSNAIEAWENTTETNSRNGSPKFNILATVCNWSEPKRTKGENYSTRQLEQENNMWFKGSDVHVTAKLMSNECDRVIYASFFFDPTKSPKMFSAGDKVRLIGAQLQMWQGCLQLTGKNIQFGQSLMMMSLSDAIEAWKFVTGVQPLLCLHKPVPGSQRNFPKLLLNVNVKMWGNPTTTKGAQIITIVFTSFTHIMLSGSDLHILAEFSCTSNADCAIRGSLFFESHLCPQAFSVGDIVELVGIEMQEWNGSAQLSGKNVQVVVRVPINERTIKAVAEPDEINPNVNQQVLLHHNDQHQQPKQPRTFYIDEANMKKAHQHFLTKSVKILEALSSYNDNFAARSEKNKCAKALLQQEQRDERQAKRFAIEERALPVSQIESAALGYAESTWNTIYNMVNLIQEVLGSSIPAFYLDIGSGSLAHCAIIASASGRFCVCDGIECSPTRFQTSQQSLLSATTSGILKTPCRIIHGDVLISKDIDLCAYNVYSFFDKVCIEVSQRTLQRVIMDHFSQKLAVGRILYFTCMSSTELNEVMHQVKQIMSPSAWGRLSIDCTRSIKLTTRFAGQIFKCTMVQVHNH
jgi:hypothetical protein